MELKRHIEDLRIWHYEYRRTNDRKVPVIMTYLTNTAPEVSIENLLDPRAARGHKMRPNIDFYPLHISSHQPSPTALRVMLAE